jgi:hypothetical protein
MRPRDAKRNPKGTFKVPDLPSWVRYAPVAVKPSTREGHSQHGLNLIGIFALVAARKIKNMGPPGSSDSKIRSLMGFQMLQVSWAAFTIQ